MLFCGTIRTPIRMQAEQTIRPHAQGERLSQKTTWTVKGIDPQVRELAKRQARKAGLTIGAWLNEAIRASEAQPGQDNTAPTPESAAQIEALLRRLDELETRLAESTQNMDRGVERMELSLASGFADLDRRIAAGGPRGGDHRRGASSRHVIDAAPRRSRAAFGAGLAAVLLVAVVAGVAFVESRAPGGSHAMLQSLADAVGLAGASDEGKADEAQTVDVDASPRELAAVAPAAGGQAPADTGDPGSASAELTYQQAQRLLAAVGGARDQSEAEQLLEIAGRQGHVGAQLDLAELYLAVGRSASDMQRGLYWLMKAANAGEATAEYRLALLYASGDKVARNYRQAATWFQRAAEQGHVDAQYNLGLLYSRGVGVVRDVQAAHHWFRLAAGNGDNEAARKRDELALLLAAASGVEPVSRSGQSGEVPLQAMRPRLRLPSGGDSGDALFREMAPLVGGGDSAAPRWDRLRPVSRGFE